MNTRNFIGPMPKRKTIFDCAPYAEVRKLIRAQLRRLGASGALLECGYCSCTESGVDLSDAIDYIVSELCVLEYDPSKSAVSTYVYMVTRSKLCKLLGLRQNKQRLLLAEVECTEAAGETP